MKLFIRTLILVVLMSLFGILIYNIGVSVIVPWLMNFDETIFIICSILGIMFGMYLFVGLGEILIKVLKCEKIVELFIGEETDDNGTK